MHQSLIASCLLAASLASAAPDGEGPDSVAERAARLDEFLAVLPHVRAEARGDRIAAIGRTRDEQEAATLARILALDEAALDLTTGALASADEMIEIDVVIVTVNDTAASSVGFNFLQLINFQYNFLLSSADRTGDAFGPSGFFGQFSDNSTQYASLLGASVDYNVNLANARDESARVLARPHLTTLNGLPAEFQSGGEIVFRVSGGDSGDIKPYPFGITLNVTPTVIAGVAPDAEDKVLLSVEAERTSVLGRLLDEESNSDVNFDKTRVLSDALLGFDETLILSGLYQREVRTRLEGVPVLRDIPVIKYFFSNRVDIDDVQSTVIFLTPRRPSSINQARQDALREFVERRIQYVEAIKAGPEAVAAFIEDNPGWFQIQRNDFTTELYLAINSEIYRGLRGYDLVESELLTQLPAGTLVNTRQARR